MNILVFSPIELPWTVGQRYSGLERLAAEFAEQWAKLGHEITLLAHKDTALPDGVKLLPCEGYVNGDRTIHAEQKAFMQYQSEFYKYDVIWDIGHLHLIARYMTNMPSANIFSANPEYEAKANHEKAPYNLISWSRWGVSQIRKWYRRESKYQETIMVDPAVYKPSGKRGDRFLTIGRMSPEKGNLNACKMCKTLGLSLDVAGGRGSEVFPGSPLREYEEAVKSLCDGKQIRFFGEVSDEEKVELMQSCKALLYVTDHTEITSHKIQEAMCSGAPAIVPNLGGVPEIVTHGVNGFLCNTIEDYRQAVFQVDRLDENASLSIVPKYTPQKVASDYVTLFEQIKGGLRW